MYQRTLLSAVLLMFAWLAGQSHSAGQAPSDDGPPKTKRSRTVPPPKWKEEQTRVFFTDVKQQLGPREGFGVAGPAAANVAGTTSSEPGTPAAAGGQSWSKLISAETLESEIKAHTAKIGQAIAVPGTFKGGTYESARRSYSVLGVMFGVIAEYDGDVRWKDKAAGLRDVTAKAGFNCKVGTDQSFSEAKKRHEDLSGLIRGEGVEVPEAESSADWNTVSDLAPLMQRLEEAQLTHLTPWTGNSGDFNANKEEALHEAEVLAVLAQIIQDESYEYGGDAGYQAYANQLRDGAVGIVEGAKGSDFAKVQASMSEVTKACTNCHGDFKG